MTNRLSHWLDLLTIGRRGEGDYWVRWTDSFGCYHWLHPRKNEWISEPDQIDMPGFPDSAYATEAAKRAPKPPTAL